jgi:hypothetical protein
VYIGLISYPLYLWHWPVLTYARIFNDGEPPAPVIRVAAMIASVILACLTYELVEKKIRRARRVAWSRWVVPALTASMATLGIYGLLAFGSLSQARSAAVPRLAAVSEAFDDRDYGGDDIIRGDSERAVLFFGDSHMRQYLPRIGMVMKHPRGPVRSVIIRVSNGCAPVPGIERRGRHCNQFVEKGLQMAHRKEVDTVVFAASWTGFISRTDYYKAGDELTGPPLNLRTSDTRWVLDGFEAELKRLADAGKKIVIVLCSPRGREFNPRAMVKKRGMDFEVVIDPSVPRSTVAAANAFSDERLRAMAVRLGATLVDPLDKLCSDTECPTVDPDGSPLFMDESHLRASVVRQRFDALDRFVYLRREPSISAEALPYRLGR